MAYLYAFITALSTLLGGWLALGGVLKNVANRYLIGFAAGAMLGIAFFDLIPEAMEGRAAAWVIAAGFFAVYVLEKFILVHASDEEEIKEGRIGWIPVIGIALESLIDGMAIAVGFALNPTLGLTIALAVIAHELPRGFATGVIMKHAGYSSAAAFSVLLIDAFFTPLGVALARLFSAGQFFNLLAFTAGVFLYVGAGDLLPEAHRQFNWKVIVSVLAGAAAILLISFFLI